jgi:CheY-like chemotaxis protein
MAAVKILLVDDDEMLNTIMRSLLEREGFDITVASNVREALKLIGSEQYDVLLSDLHMPGAADGLTVISAMRHLNPKCGDDS